MLLTTHVRPDGDALGSELAMADLLETRGKSVEILNASPTPARYQFIDPEPSRVRWIDPSNPRPSALPDLIVILDTGTWSQLAGLAPFVRESTAAKIVIDHHVSQDELGAERLVDSTSAATGMLVFEAYQALNIPISPGAAQALFVAIAMDTGWMRHPNATPDVFRAVADLVRVGAQPHEAYRQLFERNRLERLKLMRILYDHADVRVKGRVATSWLSWEEILSVGAHPMETEDFINELMSLRGVEVAVLFIGQADGGTKVSFRSRSKFDCSACAEQLAGGGHRAAAGATRRECVEEVRQLVLPIVESLLDA